MSVAALPRSNQNASSKTTTEPPPAVEEHGSSTSPGFAWGIGALAAIVAVVIAIATIGESSTFEKKAALEAAQKAGNLDSGAVAYGLQMRLEGAAAACGMDLAAGTTLKVHAVVDPSGAITSVHVATPIPGATCLASALSTVTVPAFSGSATTVEAELHAYGH